MGLKLLKVILALCFIIGPSNSRQIICDTAQDSSNHCLTLDEALKNVQSNSHLLLQPGTHFLHGDSIISDKTNVSLTGDPTNPSSVVIECDDSYGLIFMNIQQLTMSGLTVTGCGFTGIEKVISLFSTINDQIYYFFHPLYFFSTGLLLFDIKDLVMEKTLFKENEGFGMVAINIIGKSKFSSVNFLSNFPSARSVCNLYVTTAPGGSGGGLFLMYHDYVNQTKNSQAMNTTLIFEDGLIANNYNCRRDPFLTLYSTLTRTLAPSFSTNMSIVGSGGITVSLAQTRYSFSTTFDNCTFQNNTGLYYNAALEILLYNDTKESEVTVQNCLFKRNGGLFYNADEKQNFPENGIDPFGALKVALFIPLPTNVTNPSTKSLLPNPTNILISNCSFIENIALSGAGLTILSFTTTTGYITDMVTIQNCHFYKNSGNFGSAIYITELSYSGFESVLKIKIDSSQVQDNYPLLSFFVSIIQRFLADTTSAIDISNVRVSFSGRNLFIQNNMTAVSASNAILELSGLVQFSENSGVTGGALHLERESYLVLVNQTELVFESNSAQLAGGAIYVEFETVRANTFDCYLFFDRIDIYCDVSKSCPSPDNRYIIKLVNNTAPLGSSVFGSNLFDCPWNNSAVNFLDPTHQIDLTSLDPNLLIIVSDFNASNSVNTLPFSIEESKNTTSMQYQIEPGEQFSVSLSANDRLNQRVPLTIFSEIDDLLADSRVGTSNRFFLDGREFTDVPFSVTGVPGNSYNIVITTDDVLLRNFFTFEVTLTNCSLGFLYNYTTRSCQCEISEILSEVTCNNDGSISFPENQWVGFYEDRGYVQGPCIRDYCKINVTRIFLSDQDSQCRNNRSGLLCGQCATNYSRITSASFCHPCDTNNFLAFLVLFAVAGILLVVILALFNITVTDGLINGFVFYANIMGVYASTFFPVTELWGTPPFLLISFLNLHFGIQTCFYVGMTELSLVGLTLVFPIYLLFILLILVLIGRCVTHEKVSHFYEKINITHIFATILFYSYANVMETCVAILAFLSVDIERDNNTVRWGRDPNIRYGNDIHGVLVAVSIILLVLVIPLPIILLVPQISFRFKFLRNFKPVIDAFLAPFEQKKSFWISFRLVFRVVIYLIAAFGLTAEQLVTISFLITVMTLIQAYLKPFSSPSRNLVDTFLMVKLTLFSIIAIHLFHLPSTRESESMAIMFSFAYLFLILLLLLFGHYVVKSFDCTDKFYRKAINFMATLLTEKLKNPKNCCSWSVRKDSNEGKGTTANSAHSTAITHASINLNLNGSNVLRETLLEFEDQRPTPPKNTTKNTDPTSTF